MTWSKAGTARGGPAGEGIRVGSWLAVELATVAWPQPVSASISPTTPTSELRWSMP